MYEKEGFTFWLPDWIYSIKVESNLQYVPKIGVEKFFQKKKKKLHPHPHSQSCSVNFDIGVKGFQRVFAKILWPGFSEIFAFFGEKEKSKLELNGKESQIFELNRLVQSKKIVANVEYYLAFQKLIRGRLRGYVVYEFVLALVLRGSWMLIIDFFSSFSHTELFHHKFHVFAIWNASAIFNIKHKVEPDSWQQLLWKFI